MDRRATYNITVQVSRLPPLLEIYTFSHAISILLPSQDRVESQIRASMTGFRVSDPSSTRSRRTNPTGRPSIRREGTVHEMKGQDNRVGLS
jgi:hypothetical protein